MIFAMYYAIVTNEGGEYGNKFPHSLALFAVKIPCSLALHLELYPEIDRGLLLMKFVNNNPEKFVKYGDIIGFTLGFAQMITAVVASITNLYLLSFQHTVAHCIIHFVALEVITDLSKIYFEAREASDKLIEVVHKIHLKNDKHGRDIPFSERSAVHKIFRAIYRIFRSIYVSFFFYFFPFCILLMQWMQNVCHVDCEEEHEER